MTSFLNVRHKTFSLIPAACRQYLPHNRVALHRSFSFTANRPAADISEEAPANAQKSRDGSMRETYMQQLIGDVRKTTGASSSMNEQKLNEHHLYVYTTKHNTHLTLMTPEQKCLISISAGNIGFRKAARGTYDAAYQLTAYFLNQLHGRPEWDQQIKNLEVVLRGFGVGREAVTKAILGTEGRLLRGRISRVSDATRLKFGGTRSPKPRRLG